MEGEQFPPTGQSWQEGVVAGTSAAGNPRHSRRHWWLRGLRVKTRVRRQQHPEWHRPPAGAQSRGRDKQRKGLG